MASRDGIRRDIALVSELEQDRFTSLIATMAGIYHFRGLAAGATMCDLTFTPEQPLTGAVFQGGDDLRRRGPAPDYYLDPFVRALRDDLKEQRLSMLGL
jgi:hypothetical protein